ncbi:hypothetical protein ABTN30_19925, partial [Acinetobacter baumannii]
TIANDLKETREQLAVTVEEASTRLTSALASKGTEVRLEIDRSAEQVMQTLNDVGSDISSRIASAGSVAAETLTIEGSKITEALSQNVNEL